MNPSLTIPLFTLAPRRRRWWRGVLLLLTLAILGLILLWAYSSFSASHDWAAAEAEAAQDVPRWRLTELEADRPAIADAENSALHIIAVHRAGKGVSVSGAPNYGKIFEKLPPTAQLNGQQIQLIRGELAKIAKPLQDARLLKDMPRGRFPIKFSDSSFGTPCPDHQKARNLGDWFTNDAWLLAQDEQIDQAIESCQAMVNTGRAVADDPILVLHLIRIALHSMSVPALERVLAQGQGSDERLQAMQTMLDKATNENSWLTAMRGERACYHHLFDNIRTGKVTSSTVQSEFKLAPGVGLLSFMTGQRFSIEDSPLEWFADRSPGNLLTYYPEFLRHLNQCVEIAKLSIHEREPKLQEWEKTSKTSKNLVIRIFWPAQVNAHRAECRCQALLRTALVALACERYRLNKKEWPASLDVLVKEKWLASLPTDPMDNQPLRYRRHADGIVVYSVGMDKIDNQGHIDWDHICEPGVDIGFRLWNMNMRRQAPLPPVALPK